VPASEIVGIVAWMIAVLIVLSWCRAAALADKDAQDALRRRKEGSIR
jgi:uncharacterized membrane protein